MAYIVVIKRWRLGRSFLKAAGLFREVAIINYIIQPMIAGRHRRAVIGCIHDLGGPIVHFLAEGFVEFLE